MVYLAWDEFYSQAEALYRASPLDTRYCTKYRHKDGVLVLKVTDDKTCLKFKTDQAADLKKLEKLNALFFALMGRGAQGTSRADEIMAEAMGTPQPSGGKTPLPGTPTQQGQGGQPGSTGKQAGKKTPGSGRK